MALDERKGRILHAIVEDYVESAEPIGSEWLASRHDFGCKSATLRNEMAEMSDLGYLVQPHTSAGRIPSSLGYRYFVDCLMPAQQNQHRSIPEISSSLLELPLADLVQLTAKTLSSMTQYPAIATMVTNSRISIQRIYLSMVSERHLMVVALLSNGAVTQNLLACESTLDQKLVSEVSLAMNTMLVGADISAVPVIEIDFGLLKSTASAKLVRIVMPAIRSLVENFSESVCFFEGANHFLRHREFQDVMRLELLLNVLEQRNVLSDVLARTAPGQGVKVVIGEECTVGAMADCSLVSSVFKIGNREAGFLGVVGPKRMRYEQVVSAVGLMTQSLSRLLSNQAVS